MTGKRQVAGEEDRRWWGAGRFASLKANEREEEKKKILQLFDRLVKNIKEGCRDWGAAGERRTAARRENHRPCFVVQLRSSQPGRHRGGSCSPLEHLVVYLHSWLRNRSGETLKCASWMQSSKGEYENMHTHRRSSLVSYAFTCTTR